MSKVLFVFLLFAGFIAYSQNPSSLKEYKKVFKTYGFSDPDPIAKMGQIYPYFRFDGYTNTPSNKEWTVVELENDYIKVMILPEIGGKIWGAWEKPSGRPFIYYNQVVKFRDVAMRGPWTSGGIEANYGIIGHTPNCATPVDYVTERKKDGSVSCYIGTLDLLTQTYWTIEINLPRDKAYFTTRSFWYNGSGIDQPYYSWMNTGIKAAGNLEFIYPGTKYIGHEGEYADWKTNKDNGKDISFYAQNNFGGYKSYHVFGKYTDFFGAYWHNDGLGMARYSPHDEKAGKKIWIWGLSQQGMIWEKLLTDTDGQYVEVQSGRLFNQASPGSTFTPFKHTGFAPSAADSWTEYWFPVMKTGGFVKANPYGVLNVRARSGYVRVDFSALQELNESLKILEGDHVLYDRKMSVKPLTVFTDSIPFQGSTDNLIVTVGHDKLVFDADPNDGVLARPVDSPPNFDWTSAYGLYLLAKEDLHQRFYATAEEKFQQCLRKDPNYLPALSAMSMIKFRSLAYDSALVYARHALSIDTYDPAANYYYAMINVKLGKMADAKDGFDIATLTTEYRDAALIGLSKIYFSEDDVSKAVFYADKAFGANTGNVEAMQILAVAARLHGQSKVANEWLERLTIINPLNHFIRFEKYRLESSDATAANFRSLIRNELSGESYLQLAEWYYSIGQAKESLSVLLLAPENPEITYWTAFFKDQLKDKDGLSYLEKADKLSADFVFPSRQTSEEVFAWASQDSPSWKPKYYLALVYWNRNNLDRAKELLKECGNPDYAPFYAARAELMKDGNYAGDLQKAAQLDTREWRYGKMLINHYIDAENYERALATAKEYDKKFPKDFRISMLLARTLLLTKQYKACSDLLDKITILPYEGATDGKQLYNEAWLMQAISQMKQGKYREANGSIKRARQWPDRLGVGKPYDSDIDDRVESYLEALIAEKTKAGEAEAKWQHVVANKTGNKNANMLLTALALKKLGRSEEGERLLMDWKKDQPYNKIADWCASAFHGYVAPLPAELQNNGSLRIVREIVSIPAHN